MKRDDLVPAPGRGAYDRTLSRPERHARHRERLLLAAAEVLSEGELSVARIAARAGVGRSTFYEFFDSPAHLLQQIERRLARALEAPLNEALAAERPPRERARSLTLVWLHHLQARPLEARVALTPRSRSDVLSPLGRVLHSALARHAAAERDQHEGGRSATDEARWLAAASAVESVTRRHLAGPALPQAASALTEILTRLLG